MYFGNYISYLFKKKRNRRGRQEVLRKIIADSLLLRTQLYFVAWRFFKLRWTEFFPLDNARFHAIENK